MSEFSHFITPAHLTFEARSLPSRIVFIVCTQLALLLLYMATLVINIIDVTAVIVCHYYLPESHHRYGNQNNDGERVSTSSLINKSGRRTFVRERRARNFRTAAREEELKNLVTKAAREYRYIYIPYSERTSPLASSSL